MATTSPCWRQTFVARASRAARSNPPDAQMRAATPPNDVVTMRNFSAFSPARSQRPVPVGAWGLRLRSCRVL